MTWQIGIVDDPEPCIALRRNVFISEQGVPEADEIDDLDGEAIHVLATVEGQPMGTARLFVQGDTGKIGRVCVAKAARGTGLGAALMKWSITHLEDTHGVGRTKLSAQEYVIPFYEKLGFAAFGPTYDDAGIPHRDMVRDRGLLNSD